MKFKFLLCLFVLFACSCESDSSREQNDIQINETLPSNIKNGDCPFELMQNITDITVIERNIKNIATLNTNMGIKIPKLPFGNLNLDLSDTLKIDNAFQNTIVINPNFNPDEYTKANQVIHALCMAYKSLTLKNLTKENKKKIENHLTEKLIEYLNYVLIDNSPKENSIIQKPEIKKEKKNHITIRVSIPNNLQYANFKIEADRVFSKRPINRVIEFQVQQIEKAIIVKVDNENGSCRKISLAQNVYDRSFSWDELELCNQ